MKSARNKVRRNKTVRARRRHGTNANVESEIDTVWGKNKPLENWWRGLAMGKYIILIYADGTHKKVKSPPIRKGEDAIQQGKNTFEQFNNDPNIKAILGSNMSQDAYELHLYPRAKNATVDEVIRNYPKYFTKIVLNKKQLKEYPMMAKLMFPK